MSWTVGRHILSSQPRRSNAHFTKDTMTHLPPPADTVVPAWQWFVATWFGSGLVEPLRAGLAVTIAAILVIGLSRKQRLIVPVIGIAAVILGVFVSTEIGAASA